MGGLQGRTGDNSCKREGCGEKTEEEHGPSPEGRALLHGMAVFPLSTLSLGVLTFLLRRLWRGTHLSQEDER